MILPAAATLAAGTALFAWSVRGKSSSILAPSVWRGPKNRKAIALTFDDGPSESTPRILEILVKNNARATFFQVGANVQRLPAIARQVVAAGSEIGNHSHTHPRFDFTSAAFQRAELHQAQRAIEDNCAVTPRWFRAPYGIRWFGMAAAQRECGLEGVMWTSIALDWKLDGRAIVTRMKKAAASGAIFCFHDGRATTRNPDVGATTEAIAQLLPQLAMHGYELVTISELLAG